jgi:hypothetical protein
VVRDVAAGEQRRRGAVVVPRDLEGVMALAEWLRDLLEPAGRRSGLKKRAQLPSSWESSTWSGSRLTTVMPSTSV